MLEVARPFTIRLQVTTWQVNVSADDWINADCRRDAETIAAVPLLVREVSASRRDGDGAARECEQTAQVLEKYHLNSWATVLREQAERIRAASRLSGDNGG